jgi:hypothetical protein
MYSHTFVFTFVYLFILGHKMLKSNGSNSVSKRNKLKEIKLRLHPEVYTEVNEKGMNMNRKQLIAVDMPYSLARLDPLSLNISTSLYNKQIDYNDQNNEKKIKKNVLKKGKNLPSGLVEMLGKLGYIY